MIELSTREVTEFFDINKSTLTRWKNAGSRGYLSRDRWDLKELTIWWIEFIYQGPVNEETDSSLAAARRDYWQAKAEGEQLKVAELKESVVSWDKIETEWCARVAVVTSGLEAHADRLPPLLEGKSRAQMQKIIKDEVWQLRDSYARHGKYTPKPIEPKKGGKKRERKGKTKRKK